MVHFSALYCYFVYIKIDASSTTRQLQEFVFGQMHCLGNKVSSSSSSSSSSKKDKEVESYLPAGNVFGGIWPSFSGAAYWMVCNSYLGVASPLAKPESTQSQ